MALNPAKARKKAGETKARKGGRIRLVDARQQTRWVSVSLASLDSPLKGGDAAPLEGEDRVLG